MTDTGPGTPVDDIIVTGQRARGASPFAGLQWPSRGGGNVVLGPIVSGPPIMDETGNPIVYDGGRASVEIPTDGCGTGNVVGYVHSHPSGSPIPSDLDFQYARWHITNNRAPGNFGIYIVALVSNPTPGSGGYGYGVSRAEISDEEAAGAGTLEPTWVNPDAQTCPGSEG